MSYCPDPECPNIEPIEKNLTCPNCGAKSEAISILAIQDLIRDKRKAQRFNDALLFHCGLDEEALTDKLQSLLDELATLEIAKYPKSNDDIKATLLLLKINVLQNQALLQSQLSFLATVKRLLGL